MMGDDARYVATIAVPAALLFVVVLTVGARCWVRRVMLNSFALDDWVMILAAIIFAAMVTCGFVANRYGYGRHLDTLQPGDITTALELWLVMEILYLLTTMTTKLSITIFLLRLSCHRSHTYLILFVCTSYWLGGIGFIFNAIFQCTPVAFDYNKFIEGGHCRSTTQFVVGAYFNAGMSAATDILFSLLPCWMLYDVDMHWKTKVSVIMILGLGLFSGVVAIVRFPYVDRLATSPDFLFDVVPIAIWSVVEPGVGITAASLATLRPLFRSFCVSLGLTQPSQHYNYYERNSSRFSYPGHQYRGALRSGSVSHSECRKSHQGSNAGSGYTSEHKLRQTSDASMNGRVNDLEAATAIRMSNIAEPMAAAAGSAHIGQREGGDGRIGTALSTIDEARSMKSSHLTFASPGEKGHVGSNSNGEESTRQSGRWSRNSLLGSMWPKDGKKMSWNVARLDSGHSSDDESGEWSPRRNTPQTWV